MKKLLFAFLIAILIPFSAYAQVIGPGSGMIGGIPHTFSWDVDIGSTSAGKNLNVNATLGTEKITWTALGWDEGGVEWTVAGTPIVITHATGNTTALTSTLASAIVAGVTYKIVITYTQVAGTCIYTLGGVTGSSIATSATSTSITDYITAATTGQMIITPLTTSNIVISSISIKALTDATGDLTVDGNLTVRSPVTFNSPVFSIPGGEIKWLLGGVTIGKLRNGNTSPYDTVAWGINALEVNTGDFNTAIGAGVLSKNTSGHHNTGVGDSALLLNTTGHLNTAMGESALFTNVDGGTNTAMGVNTLFYNTTGGDENSAIGAYALYKNTTGSQNIAIGVYAGHNAGVDLQTNSNSVFVGYQANTSVNALTNVIVIGSTAQATKSNQVILGNASITETLLRGNIGIGTTTPVGKQHTVLSATTPALFGGDLIKNVTGVTISNATPSHLSKDTDIDTNIAAGDMVIVQSGTNATTGIYTVTAVADNDITIDRNAVTGACTNAVVDFVKDVIGFFPTDGTNGQRLAGYSHQNKPLQIGGHTLGTTSGYTSEDVIIGGILKVDVSARKFVVSGDTQSPIFTVGDIGGYYTIQGISSGAYTPANSYYMDDQTGVGISIGRATGAFAGLYVNYDGNVAIGTVSTSQLFTLGEIKTITGAVTDGYSAALRLDPGYTAATAQTVTRHNYIDVQNVSVAGIGPAAVTDSAVFRFDNVAGTHNALASNAAVAVTIGAGPTGSTAGNPQGWMKINVNGTLRYMPYW